MLVKLIALFAALVCVAQCQVPVDVSKLQAIMTAHPDCAKKYTADVAPCSMKASQDLMAKVQVQDPTKINLDEICCLSAKAIDCMRPSLTFEVCKDAKAELTHIVDQMDTTLATQCTKDRLAKCSH